MNVKSSADAAVMHPEVPSDDSEASRTATCSSGLQSRQTADDSDGDDEVFVLDDDGQEVKVKTSEDWGPVQDHITLCGVHSHVVTTHDYKTLAHEEYLNDAIINFYLSWLLEQLQPAVKSTIHVFPSQFFCRLSARPAHNCQDPDKSQAERSYHRTKRWTRKLNLFSKKMLIIPICEEHHWYILVVCNLDMANKWSPSVNGPGEKPFIMVLDSLGGSHTAATNKIRSYLQFEYREKNKISVKFGRDTLPELKPDIPLQHNLCDCGVYLLHYVELIFKDPVRFRNAKLPNLANWFKPEDIDRKREAIAMLIQRLAKQQGTPVLAFPPIDFPQHSDGECGGSGSQFVADAIYQSQEAEPKSAKQPRLDHTTASLPNRSSPRIVLVPIMKSGSVSTGGNGSSGTATFIFQSPPSEPGEKAMPRTLILTKTSDIQGPTDAIMELSRSPELAKK